MANAGDPFHQAAANAGGMIFQNGQWFVLPQNYAQSQGYKDPNDSFWDKYNAGLNGNAAQGMGYGGGYNITPPSSFQNPYQMQAISSQAGALADLWGQQAQAGASMHNADVGANASMYNTGLNTEAQQNIAGTQAGAQKYGADKNLEASNFGWNAQQGIAGTQADAAKYGADKSLLGIQDTNKAGMANTQTNALAQMYGYDTSKDVANIQNEPAMGKLDLLQSLLGGTGGGLGGALGGLIGGAGTGAPAGGAGSTGTGAPGTGSNASLAPAQPRFNPYDEQRQDARAQSLIARKYAGERNALTDQYAQQGLMPGGAGFRSEQQGLGRQELSDLLNAQTNTHQQALDFNQNQLQNTAQSNQAYQAQQDIELRRQQLALQAQQGNPLWQILSGLLAA